MLTVKYLSCSNSFARFIKREKKSVYWLIKKSVCRLSRLSVLTRHGVLATRCKRSFPPMSDPMTSSTAFACDFRHLVIPSIPVSWYNFLYLRTPYPSIPHRLLPSPTLSTVNWQSISSVRFTIDRRLHGRTLASDLIAAALRLWLPPLSFSARRGSNACHYACYARSA